MPNGTQWLWRKHSIQRSQARKPLGGEINYRGDSQLLEDAKQRAKTFSVVLTDRIDDFLSVWQVVAWDATHSNWFGKLSDEDEKVEWALEVVHAKKLIDRKLYTLSDGKGKGHDRSCLIQDTPLIF